MRNNSVFFAIIVFVIGIISCEEKEVEAGFEDMEQSTIYDYIVENEEDYSSFLQILKEGNVDRILSAYNPEGNGYTLFLPNNDAISNFIQQNDNFNSLDELLSNTAYAAAFGKYHAVNIGIHSNDFPFGALPENTFSNDFLTVSFVIEADTSYYKINNQAPIIRPNIELSNGYIHVIGSALNPITYTSYNWLEQTDGYSIFKAAVDITGFDKTLDLNIKDEENEERPFTMFLEHDSVFQKHGIGSLDDLIGFISPDDQDYSNPENSLYNFIGYHMIPENHFLDDFVGENTNFSTYSEVPLNINGVGLDILINKGKQAFDTIVSGPDTTIIDFISFNYDASNLLTQSGAIHFIDRMMTQQQPSRANQTFQFYEEPLFNEFRQELGSYIIEDSSSLTSISYSGSDLFFVQEGESSTAWSDDYILMEGDFSITYRIPKIVQGKYDVFLGAQAFSRDNALIEVYIDGKNAGGLIDLSSGGNANNPFARIELGTVDFLKYEGHTIEIRTLIPGTLRWDYIRFEPFTN